MHMGSSVLGVESRIFLDVDLFNDSREFTDSAKRLTNGELITRWALNTGNRSSDSVSTLRTRGTLNARWGLSGDARRARSTNRARLTNRARFTNTNSGNMRHALRGFPDGSNALRARGALGLPIRNDNFVTGGQASGHASLERINAEILLKCSLHIATSFEFFEITKNVREETIELRILLDVRDFDATSLDNSIELDIDSLIIILETRCLHVEG